MPYSVDALSHRLRRSFGGTCSLQDCADEVRVVHSEEDELVRPAIFLPDQLDRVTGAHEWSTIGYERDRVFSKRSSHAATLAMRFSTACLVNGVIYAGSSRARECTVDEQESVTPVQVSQRLNNVTLSSSLIGNKFFGHFIADNCGTMLLAQEYGESYFTQKQGCRSGHEKRYLEIYELPERELRTAEFRNLWLFQDYAMNTHKCERLLRLRELVRSHGQSNDNKRVFFRRRGAGVPRFCINEQEVEQKLAEEGFDIIDVTESTVDEIIRRASGAQIICGIEGSALVHGLLSMADNAGLICIQPPSRFNVCLKDHTDAFGYHYGFTVGKQQGDTFFVDVDDLLATIDLIETSVA